MPVDSYHHNIIKPKTADLTNSAGKPDAASSQAAAFL
jgi:leucyl aminopeptidase